LAKQIKERLTQRQLAIDTAKHGLETGHAFAGAAVAKLQGKNPDDLYRQLLGLESRAKLEQELEAAKQHLAKIVAAAASHWEKKDPAAEAKITEAKAAIEQTTKEIALLKQTIDILRAVLKHPHDASNCPVCSQTMDPCLVSETRLGNIEWQLSQASTVWSAAQKKLTDTETAQRAWEGESHRIAQAQLTQTQRVNKLTTDLQALGTGNLEQVRADYKACAEASTELQAAKRDIANYERQLKLFEAQLFSSAEVQAADGFSAELLQVTLTEKTAAALSLSRLQTLKLLLGTKQQALQRAQSDASAATAALDAGVQAFRLLQSSPPSVELAVAVAGGGLDAKLAEIAGKDRQRAECAGRLTQAQAQLKTLQDKENEIEDRIHKNAARQQVVEDLVRLRGVLARQGLPLAYVEYQFLRLTTLAQQSLSDLGANFTVEVHPERPVAFTFTRLDEADGVSMDMSKLSGGQKVRLSIAFLLAVQKLLIPEVGLLVLDEPSTHMDIDGVESLKELLLGMAQTLQNSEHQVWVVDHHETLQTAFGSCLQLK